MNFFLDTTLWGWDDKRLHSHEAAKLFTILRFLMLGICSGRGALLDKAWYFTATRFQKLIDIDGLYIIKFYGVTGNLQFGRHRMGTHKKGTNLLDFFVTKHHDACNDIYWFTL